MSQQLLFIPVTKVVLSKKTMSQQFVAMSQQNISGSVGKRRQLRRRMQRSLLYAPRRMQRLPHFARRRMQRSPHFARRKMQRSPRRMQRLPRRMQRSPRRMQRPPRRMRRSPNCVWRQTLCVQGQWQGRQCCRRSASGWPRWRERSQRCRRSCPDTPDVNTNIHLMSH